MPRGGARVNSGPTPDPNALRRDRAGDREGWTYLPAAGFTGPIPGWPLVADASAAAMQAIAAETAPRLRTQIEECTNRRRLPSLEKKLLAAETQWTVVQQQIEQQESLETDLWAGLWRTPQAAAWAEMVWPRDVAAYVRHKVRGELGSMDDAKEARQWSDRLGLNPAAMLRNRWRIATTPAAPPPTKATRRPSSARNRFTVVDGDGDQDA